MTLKLSQLYMIKYILLYVWATTSWRRYESGVYVWVEWTHVTTVGDCLGNNQLAEYWIN